MNTQAKTECFILLLAFLTTGLVRAEMPISKIGVGQNAPDVAFNGRDYVVVWADARRGGYSDIFGARITRSGTLLDTANFLISGAPGSQRNPTVWSDGKNCMVTWEDASGRDLNIDAAIVDRDGKLPWVELAICAAPGDQATPVVAYDGKNYLVVWTDHRGSDWQIYAARVAPDGKVLDPDGFPLSNEFVEAGTPAVGFDGKDYLVAWTAWHTSYYHVHFARVSPDGTVLPGPVGEVLTQENRQARSPAIAFDGKNYLVTWTDFRNGWNDIFGSRITPDGRVLDSAGIDVSTTPIAQEHSALAWGKNGYLAAWQDMRDGDYWQIYATQISPAGKVIFPSGIAIAGGQRTQLSPALASDGEGYLAVWQDLRDSNGAIYGSMVTKDGEVK